MKQTENSTTSGFKFFSYMIQIINNFLSFVPLIEKLSQKSRQTFVTFSVFKEIIGITTSYVTIFDDHLLLYFQPNNGHNPMKVKHCYTSVISVRENYPCLSEINTT